MTTLSKCGAHILVVGSMLMITGCSPWVKITNRYHTFSDTVRDYKVELPRGWRQLGQNSDPLLLTRNGFTLQTIEVHGNSLHRADFEHTQRKVQEDMLPQDIAEVILDDTQLNQAFSEVDALENSPVTIGGLPGFKLVVAYTTLDGLPVKRVIYGLLAHGMLYRFIYTAPARYYFEQDRQAIDELVHSFEFISRRKKKTTA